MEQFSAVLPATAPQINKCKCDCGPHHISQWVTSHSPTPPTLPCWVPSPHQCNKQLWAPAELCCQPQQQLLKAQPNLHQQCSLHPDAAIPVLQGPTHCCCFTPKSLHSKCVCSHQTLLPCSPSHDIHCSTHPCFQAKACPLRRLLPSALENTNSRKVLQSFGGCHTF